MAVKKVEQTVITEGKFYTISAANGKVISDNDAPHPKIPGWKNPCPNVAPSINTITQRVDLLHAPQTAANFSGVSNKKAITR